MTSPRAWCAVALAALPVAWLLARSGHGMVVQQPWRDAPWLLVLALSEEIIFRGGLQAALMRYWPGRTATPPVDGVDSLPHRLLHRTGLSRANLLASLAFSAAHLWAHTPAHALAVFPVSLLLGIAYERSGRLWLPAALHAWFNLVLYAASLWLLRP